LKEETVKTPKFPFAIACVLALAASCLAQNADTNAPTKKTLGIEAARAAALRALKAPDVGPDNLPPAASFITGKFVFTITIHVNPGVPTTSKIYCSASATTSEASSFFFDDGAALATRTGGTATCSMTLFYGWFLATSASDKVAIGVSVTSAIGTLGTPPYETLESSQSLLMAVPASGATTPVSVTTAI
jgi:hypothetical protein